MKQTHTGQAHLTLNEIADMLDLTRERVRQIEAKAIMKLRKKMQLKGIKPSDLLSS
jgi:DNA-directed RNA polymerase sigma subunit (sigma70/sigma32)